MSQSPGRVDLRLTIPAAGPYPALAAELAAKFAEYAGAVPDAAGGLARDIEASLAAIGEASPDASVQLEMLSRDRELVVTLNSGSTRKLTCPLPD
jgi:hypothetical protein